MPFGEVPSIPLVYPAMRDPAIVRTSALPMPGHPFVSSTCPSPIAPEPHVVGAGWRPVLLESGRRRSGRHYRAHVIPMWWRGRNDASAKCHSKSHPRKCAIREPARPGRLRAPFRGTRPHGNCYHLARTFHMDSKAVRTPRLMTALLMTTMALVLALIF
jgi:hypothetical protein